MSLKSKDFVSQGLLWKSEFDSKYEQNLDKATDNVCDWVRLFENMKIPKSINKDPMATE